MDTVHRLDYTAGQPGGSAGPSPNYQANAAPPPSYWTSMRTRVTPSTTYSLRPVLIFTTLISFLYLVIIAIANFKSLNDPTETGTLRLFDIITAALCLFAAVVELFGFLAALRTHLAWASLYAKASTLALAAVIAADVVAIVEQFAAKGDLIGGCTKTYTGAATCDGNESWFGAASCTPGQPMTAEQAGEYCNSQWKKGTIWVFVWLVLALLLGSFFVLLAFSFVRQLRDPSSVRAWTNRGAAGRNGGAPTQPGAAGYSNAFTYDDESSPFDAHGGGRGRYSYEEDDGAFGRHAYPPPQGPPPAATGVTRGSGADDDAPAYEAPPRKSMASIDLDRKDPNLARGDEGQATGGNAYGYGYRYEDEGDQQQRRPGSSRGANAAGQRTSDETLRGEGGENGRDGHAKV